MTRAAPDTDMQSRSVRHRMSRCRTVLVRQAEARKMVPSVLIELRDAKGIWQSFLIFPGSGTSAVLSGYMDTFGGMRRIDVPVTISARIA